MILNWTYGTEMELEVISKTFSNISSTQLLSMPLTVTPIAVFLRTTAAGSAELCAYYRADQAGMFTMRASTGGTTARTRMQDDLESLLLLNASGGTESAPAQVECYVLGVKK